MIYRQYNSSYNNKRRYRDIIYLCVSIFLLPLYIPHLLAYFFECMRGGYIRSDVVRYSETLNINVCAVLGLLFFLHTSSYFRSLFYYRIGPIWSMVIGWYRRGNSSFVISKTTTIGKAFMAVHPFSTIINAEKIGDNFNCKNCTTIASKHSMNDRPIIGNNVELGANVVIIGPVVIGDNVVIGAGSVVVKDIPDNVIAAGNPAKVIKSIS